LKSFHLFVTNPTIMTRITNILFAAMTMAEASASNRVVWRDVEKIDITNGGEWGRKRTRYLRSGKQPVRRRMQVVSEPVPMSMSLSMSMSESMSISLPLSMSMSMSMSMLLSMPTDMDSEEIYSSAQPTLSPINDRYDGPEDETDFEHFAPTDDVEIDFSMSMYMSMSTGFDLSLPLDTDPATFPKKDDDATPEDLTDFELYNPTDDFDIDFSMPIAMSMSMGFDFSLSLGYESETFPVHDITSPEEDTDFGHYTPTDDIDIDFSLSMSMPTGFDMSVPLEEAETTNPSIPLTLPENDNHEIPEDETDFEQYNPTDDFDIDVYISMSMSMSMSMDYDMSLPLGSPAPAPATTTNPATTGSASTMVAATTPTSTTAATHPVDGTLEDPTDFNIYEPMEDDVEMSMPMDLEQSMPSDEDLSFSFSLSMPTIGNTVDDDDTVEDTAPPIKYETFSNDIQNIYVPLYDTD